MTDHPPAPGPGFWYFAGPYSDNPELRYLQHMEGTASLLNSGIFVFSTIVHCHALANRYAMPTDAEFWKEYNFNMIEKSNGIILYQLPTWRESKGVKDELLFCQMKALPVWALQPIGETEKNLEWSRLY